MTCCYFRGDDGEVVSKNITVTSNATDHSRIAAHFCTTKVIEELNKTVQIAKVHVWSDGCAAQFRSRYVFDLIAQIDEKCEVIWCYNERHHGKGPMDGVGGTIKFSETSNPERRKPLMQNHLQNTQITQLMVSSLYICLNVMFPKNQMKC